MSSTSTTDAPPPPNTPNRPPPPTSAQIAASGGAASATTQSATGSTATSGNGSAPTINPLLGTPLPVKPPVGGDPPPVTPPPVIPPVSQVPPVPPARTALVAGDFNARPDYDRGTPQVGYTPVQVLPVLARPTDTQAPTLVASITVPPPNELAVGSADATLSKIISDTKAWVSTYPYPATGENAVVLQFYRDLASQQQQRVDAIAHGQTPTGPDPADATTTPPPEFYALRDLAQNTVAALTAASKAMTTAGLALLPADQAAADAAMAKAQSVLPTA